jgi:PAS domain S-box-containing protein
VKQYCKNITILYVEDDENILHSLTNFLNNIFKKVITATNGQEGYDLFSHDHINNKEIDIIISDITMPEKNGIDMIKEIQLLKKDIPFLLITAHSTIEYLKQAIQLGVSHYIVKPFQLKDLTLHLVELSKQIYEHRELINKTKEIKEYNAILNQVALVSMTDTQGIIKYANDVFCEVSGYEKDFLIGKNHNIVRHPDMLKVTFKMMWHTIQSGTMWKGKIKNLAKDGSAYYVEANIFPLFENDNHTIKGYIGVRFLTTTIENNKRDFKQRVIQNLINQKKIVCDYEGTINNLQSENHTLRNKLSQVDDIQLIIETLNNQRNKNQKLLNQIQSYEQQLEDSILKNQKIAQKAKDREAKAIDDLKQLQVKYESSREVVIALKNENLQQSKIINEKQTKIDEYVKKINNLLDVIQYKDGLLNNKIK